MQILPLPHHASRLGLQASSKALWTGIQVPLFCQKGQMQIALRIHLFSSMSRQLHICYWACTLFVDYNASHVVLLCTLVLLVH